MNPMNPSVHSIKEESASVSKQAARRLRISCESCESYESYESYASYAPYESCESYESLYFQYQ